MVGRYSSSNIPVAANEFIVTCMTASGVSVVAFTPSGGWVVVGRDGDYKAAAIPQDCFTRLQQVMGQGWNVRSIAFPPAGGDSWVIAADQGHYANGIPDDCDKAIQSVYASGGKILCVTFPPGGGDSWAVIADNETFAADIDDQCFQFLKNYGQGPYPATQLTFAPNGGWVIYGGQAYYASHFDNACFEQIGTFENAGFLVQQVALTAAGGWAVIANDELPSSPDQVRLFENKFLQDAAGQWQSIYDRMAFWGVPGASVAFVEDNAVSWRTSYGVLEAGGSQCAYTNTPFQAASISKPYASIGVQLLAEKGSIALSDPVGECTTWPVALRACAPSWWAGQSLVQLILQHTGGFIGTGNTYPLTACADFGEGGGGFAGYRNIPGVVLPTLDEILSGAPPANSPPIQISTQPGKSFYSGMGYVVLMRMIQDVTTWDYRTWMQQYVLTPMGMTGSTFDLTLPAALSRAAAGHDTEGQPIPGLRNLYPEASAAGLYSNAGDLCQAVIMLNAGGTVNGNQILSRQQADEMLSNQLGIFTAGQPSQANYLFNHAGGNAGFSALMQGYPNQRTGMAIMTNRDNGDGQAASFYREVVNALTRTYGIQT